MRICLTRERDPDLIRIKMAGYSLPVLLSVACFAEAGRMEDVVLTDVDTTVDIPEKEIRPSVKESPEILTPDLYEKTRNMTDKEKAAFYKKIFRKHILVRDAHKLMKPKITIY